MSWSICLMRFWGLCVMPFVRDPTQKGALLRPLGMVLSTIAMTGASVAMTIWYRSFYDALEAKTYGLFFQLLLVFAGLATLHISLALLRLWITRALCIQWRHWATDTWTTAWLSHRRFYHLELLRDRADNPDQRISEDLRQCTVQALELMMGVLTNGLALVSFVGMLWVISGPLEFTLGNTSWTIPGYMVWVAILYAICGSWLAHRIGSPLNDLNFRSERYEADYRANLFRLREHAESIALYGGEKAEQQQLQGRFQHIIDLWHVMTSRRLKLLGFVTGYNQVAIIFPILIAAPQYFLTAMTLGVLMQITSAFRQVNEALSWFVDNYAQLSQWRASIERLLTFWDSLEAPYKGLSSGHLVRQTGDEARLQAADAFTLSLPTGELLLNAPSLCMSSGSRVLLSGPSGCGKSTLLRAFAGLWPFGSGELHHPSGRVLFLPQRPYLPTGTLRHVLAFPSSATEFTDEELHTALTMAELGSLCKELDLDQNWSIILSGGEQQRLGFARVFLQRPRWLFLDESTSALDEFNEKKLFERLHQLLPECAILTVAHRPYLAEYHHEVWKVSPDEHGARLQVQGLPAT